MRRLIGEVSAFHKMDVERIKLGAQRHHIAIRRQFYRAAYQEGVGTTTIARFICKDVSTVRHHVVDLIRAKKSRKLQCTMIPTNAETRSTA